ncbi:MAG: hypothetical protein EOP22_08785 [Hyphomicrobiales bacterium]|nr:MAG: hypothetical protein EOP22_08785 [Hyphomicrobiales bacterium]
MDVYSLAATQLHSGNRSAPKDGKSEDRYYAEGITLPRLAPGLVGPIIVCALLIFIGLPVS